MEAGIGCPSGTFGAGTTNDIEVILLFSDEFLKTMDCIVAALREKGYDPYKQLSAYVTENDLEYITRHNQARRLVATLDRTQVWQYIKMRWH